MSGPTDTFESQVREMLHRRAADVHDVSEHDLAIVVEANHADEATSGPTTQAIRNLPTRPPARPLRPLLVAACVAVLVLAGAAVAAVGRLGESAGELDTVAEADDPAATTTTTTATTATMSPSLSAAGTAMILTEDELLADVLSMLPTGFDPWANPVITIDWSTTDPDVTARRYVTDEISSEATVDGRWDVKQLWIYRWESGGQAGWLVLRPHRGQPAVIASTTDGLNYQSVARSVDSLQAEIAVDSSTVLSTTIQAPGAPPALFGNDGDQFRLELDVGSDVVKIASRYETQPSLTEFIVDSVGFGQACGVEPPISIETGSVVGALSDGPADGAPPLLTNQQAWHHPGELASVEIRWPVTPALIAFDEPDSWMKERGTLSFGHEYITVPESQWPETLSVATVLYLGPEPSDPCSAVEITVEGDAAVADWWAGALSAEWSFKFPLSLADLDPADPANQVDPQFEETTDMLAGRRVLDAVPVIAATGSCDGLPDAPPQVGPGLEETYPSAQEALSAFLAQGPHGDPPISTTGYTEIEVDGVVAAYAMLYDDVAYTVIYVNEGSDDWSLDSWSAAAC